jgi:hypothetical protein
VFPGPKDRTPPPEAGTRPKPVVSRTRYRQGVTDTTRYSDAKEPCTLPAPPAVNLPCRGERSSLRLLAQDPSSITRAANQLRVSSHGPSDAHPGPSGLAPVPRQTPRASSQRGRPRTPCPAPHLRSMQRITPSRPGPHAITSRRVRCLYTSGHPQRPRPPPHEVSTTWVPDSHPRACRQDRQARRKRHGTRASVIQQPPDHASQDCAHREDKATSGAFGLRGCCHCLRC